MTALHPTPQLTRGSADSCNSAWPAGCTVFRSPGQWRHYGRRPFEIEEFFDEHFSEFNAESETTLKQKSKSIATRQYVRVECRLHPGTKVCDQCLRIQAVEFQKQQHYSGAGKWCNPEVYRRFLNTIHFTAINGKIVANGKLVRTNLL